MNLEIMKQLIACGITSMYKTFNSSLVSALVLVESVCMVEHSYGSMLGDTLSSQFQI